MRLFVLAWTAVFFLGCAVVTADPYAPPADHYAAVDATTSANLRRTLHQTVAGHRSISYGQVWEALMVLDEDPENADRVILLYSRDSRAKSLRSQGNELDNWWNREHVWPLSRGPGRSSTVAGTDLHHLFPADQNVNARRASLPFDRVRGGQRDPEAPGNRFTPNAWEPDDAAKGVVARALFYMAIRYEPHDDVPDVGDLELAETAGSLTMARLSTLLSWHREFPVTETERRRNHLIFTEYQGNRNPFIDHPEWAEKVFGSRR